MRRSVPRSVRSLVGPPPALLLTLLLVACGGPSGGGGGSGDVACGDRDLAAAAVGFAGNNNAVLNGPAYGGGSSDAALSCTVPLEITGDAGGFVVGDASLMRRDAASTGVYLTVPVRNDGAARCFVQFSGTALLDRSGRVLVSEANDYLQGSVGLSMGGVHTDTCLDEGETGYLFNIFSERGLFDDVARVRIGAIEGDAGVAAPTMSVQPQEYQVSAGGGDLAVTVRNEGGGEVELGEFSLYIRLGAGGDPYGWSFFDDPTASALAPGASVVYSDSVAFDGSAAGMHVYVDAVPAGAGLRAAGGAPAVASPTPRERWRLRNARAASQHAEFASRLERGR